MLVYLSHEKLAAIPLGQWRRLGLRCMQIACGSRSATEYARWRCATVEGSKLARLVVRREICVRLLWSGYDLVRPRLKAIDATRLRDIISTFTYPRCSTVSRGVILVPWLIGRLGLHVVCDAGMRCYTKWLGKVAWRCLMQHISTIARRLLHRG